MLFHIGPYRITTTRSQGGLRFALVRREVPDAIEDVVRQLILGRHASRADAVRTVDFTDDNGGAEHADGFIDCCAGWSTAARLEQLDVGVPIADEHPYA